MNGVSRVPFSARLLAAVVKSDLALYVILPCMGVREEAMGNFLGQFENQASKPHGSPQAPGVFLQTYRKIKNSEMTLADLGATDKSVRAHGLPTDKEIIDVMGPNAFVERGNVSWEGDQLVIGDVSKKRGLEILRMRQPGQGVPGALFAVRVEDVLPKGFAMRTDTEMHNLLLRRWDLPQTVLFFNQQMGHLNAEAFEAALASGGGVVQEHALLSGNVLRFTASRVGEEVQIGYTYTGQPHFIGDPPTTGSIIQRITDSVREIAVPI